MARLFISLGIDAMCRSCACVPFVMTCSLLLATLSALWGFGLTNIVSQSVEAQSGQNTGRSTDLPEGVLLRLHSVVAKEAPKSATPLSACVAYSPDGKTLATGGFDSPLCLWQATTGKEIFRLQGPVGTIGQVSFSPDGTILTCAGQDKIIHLWEPAARKKIGALRGHTAWIRSLAFSSDGRILATGDQDHEIRIWDVATRKQVSVLRGSNGLISSLSFSPDGKSLASASDDGQIRLWDLASRKEIKSWEGESHVCVAFSPSNNKLAMTGRESSIWIRDAASGKAIYRLSREPLPVESLVFSPDGRLIVAGGSRELYFWEASTGKVVLHIRRSFHFGTRCLAFSPDGRALATAGLDESVLVWDLTGWGQRQPPNGPELKPDQLAVLWSELTGEDSAKAHRAIWSLVAAPKQALPLLKTQLKPVGADSKEALRLIERLDDDSFEVRKKALAELEKLGEPAAPALRRKLTEQPSAEARRQIERLLDKLDAKEQKEHADRALAVLEYMGTPEAQDLLKSLASGNADSTITRNANQCLERLAKRGVAKP
jgi:WD40 repeat protein